MTSSQKIKQAMRDHNTVESVLPLRKRRALDGAEQAIDAFGAVRFDAIRPWRLPLVGMLPEEYATWRTPRAGTISLIASHAHTAPSTGDLEVKIYAQPSDGSGWVHIHTHYHPQSLTVWEDKPTPTLAIDAGSWVDFEIQSSGSAANVSLSLVVDVG